MVREILFSSCRRFLASFPAHKKDAGVSTLPLCDDVLSDVDGSGSSDALSLVEVSRRTGVDGGYVYVLTP